MSTDFVLEIRGPNLRSKEEVGDSSRHDAVGFSDGGPEFVASAGRLFFVQELARAAGLGAGASEDCLDGDGRVIELDERGFRRAGAPFACLDTEEMVDAVLSIAPGAPITLVVGTADLSACSHEPACGRDLVSHYCPWGEIQPVDRDLCEVCDFKVEFTRSRNGRHAQVDLVRCKHPDAVRNLRAMFGG